MLHSSSNGTEIGIYIQLPSCQPLLCRLGSASSQSCSEHDDFLSCNKLCSGPSQQLRRSLCHHLRAAFAIPAQSLPHCGTSRALTPSREVSWGLPAHQNPTALLWPAWPVCSAMDKGRSMHSPQERREASNMNWGQSRETLLMAAADLDPYLHQEHVHISTLPLCSQGNKITLGHSSNPCPPHWFSGGFFFPRFYFSFVWVVLVWFVFRYFID